MICQLTLKQYKWIKKSTSICTVLKNHSHNYYLPNQLKNKIVENLVAVYLKFTGCVPYWYYYYISVIEKSSFSAIKCYLIYEEIKFYFIVYCIVIERYIIIKQMNVYHCTSMMSYWNYLYFNLKNIWFVNCWFVEINEPL